MKAMSNTEKDLIQSEQDLDQAIRAVAVIEKKEVEPKKTPMDMVENSVADFLQKAIDVTMYSTALDKALEESFIDDIKSGNMKTDEKITLYNIQKQQGNDRLFKILSPSFSVVTSRQQAEIQAQAKREQQQAAAVQVNVNQGLGGGMDAQVASGTSAEVETGLNALFQLMQAAAARKAAQKTEE